MNPPGILSLQGGFEAHGRTLERLGASPVYVKTPEQLNQVDRLIIPGGESTVMMKLLERQNMTRLLMERIDQGMPVFGTCAGLILLSSGVIGMNQPTLKAMDIQVERNAYGRQSASFECTLPWQSKKIPAVFIRAPRILKYSKEVEILIQHEETPVLVRQKNCLAASFHPELMEQDDLHRYFLTEI